METFESLVRAEFAPKNTYLNTASCGLLPARTVEAMRVAVASVADGRPSDMFDDVEAARAAFARLAGVPAGRVAAGASVAVYSGLIAASLPPGAEVLTAEDDFSSVVNPFHVRGDLKLRAVPLERIAESVRPGTALVAVSAAQSRTGGSPIWRASPGPRASTGRVRTSTSPRPPAGCRWRQTRTTSSSSVAFKWLVCPRGAGLPGRSGGPRRAHSGVRRLGRG